MEGSTLILEDESGGNPDSFLPGVLVFFGNAVRSCLAHDTDKLCGPVGFSCLSALLLLLSCVVLVCQRCRYQVEKPGEAMTSLYSFLGNLCGTTGAVLSRQIHIQVLLAAFAAAVDVVTFISCCLPLCLCWISEKDRRLRRMRKRRRQYLLSVSVLMVLGGGFLKAGVGQSSADISLPLQRRLLSVSFRDDSDILGYILGLLSFVIACTSRFPAVCRASRGQMMTRAHVVSGVLCSVAGASYAASILLYDTHYAFLLRVMPWLLSAVSCAILDLLFVLIHLCRRGTTNELPVRFSSDTESLLGCSDITIKDSPVIKSRSTQEVHSTAQTKMKNVLKVTEMGCYIDVIEQPARKIWLKEVTVSEEETEELPVNRVMRVIRVDSFYSSDTSFDSSVVSSDLEWDFEEANVQWSETAAKQQEGDEYLLQECPSILQPFNIYTCNTSGQPENTEEGKRVSAAVVA